MSLTLIQGDAAAVLADQIEARSISMVYSDPPFGNEQLWTGAAGTFDDQWRWSSASASGWSALRRHSPIGADLMAVAAAAPRARAYLGVMAGILLGIHRVLTRTGTLWLHFDDTMGAHLRILGDVVFGPENQLGLVIWKRSSAHSGSFRRFGRIHDTIACWGRSRAARSRLWRIGSSELVHGGFDVPAHVDGFVDDRLNSAARERVGYPTQKPVSLIRRLVAAGTVTGDTVLDPTCGSGSALVAARELGRSAIGIDISADALAAARSRLLPPAPAQIDLFETFA